MDSNPAFGCTTIAYRVIAGDYMKEPTLKQFFPSFDEAVAWLRIYAQKVDS